MQPTKLTVAAEVASATNIVCTIPAATTGLLRQKLLSFRFTAHSTGTTAVAAKVSITIEDGTTLVYRVPLALSLTAAAKPFDFKDPFDENLYLLKGAASTITVLLVLADDTAAAVGVRLTLYAFSREE